MATPKQKKAFDKTLKNGGNVTKAMKEAEYAEATIHNPKNLTESDGWQELVNKYIPDEDLARVHKEGLGATKVHGTQDDFIEIPDYSTRHKYMESGYKLKGRHQEEKQGIYDNNILILIQKANDLLPDGQRDS